MAALVGNRKESDATYLYFAKAFYVFPLHVSCLLNCKCTDLLAKVLKSVRIVRNIVVKRVADIMKVKTSFFSCAQCTK